MPPEPARPADAVREALRPFAMFASVLRMAEAAGDFEEPLGPDQPVCIISLSGQMQTTLTVADFDRAAAALTDGSGGSDQ